MNNTFYSKELGPLLYPADAVCPDGMFERLEAYQAWLDSQAPAKTLDETLTAKLAELRAVRLAAEYGGFMLYGRKWDSELKDEQRLTSMVTLMKETGMASFDGWKIAEGVYITLTFELALEAAVAMFGHYAACFAEEAGIAAEIGALDSAEAVQAYEINFNMQGAK